MVATLLLLPAGAPVECGTSFAVASCLSSFAVRPLDVGGTKHVRIVDGDSLVRSRLLTWMQFQLATEHNNP
jgi:hypothetical protein